MKRPPPAGWGRYAAPAAFLAVATIAIVLVASALHGQPPGEPAAPSSTAAATATTATTTQARTTTAPGGRRFYTVVAGDTFGAIAGKTGTTVQELQQLNPDVSSTSLHIGQRLRVG